MTQKFPVILFAIPLLLAACKSGTRVEATRSDRTSPDAGAVASQNGGGAGFDYYLLSLSWSPEFCYSHRDSPECALHSTFVMHGMWPENNDGTYPENCASKPGPADPSQYKDLYPDPSLLAHEWEKHGTCTGLDADTYFTSARKAFRSVKVPQALSGLDAQMSLPPDRIIQMFMDSNPSIPVAGIAVSCGHNFLTAVEVCLDKSLHPVACGGLRSCRARTVRIPPP